MSLLKEQWNICVYLKFVPVDLNKKESCSNAMSSKSQSGAAFQELGPNFLFYFFKRTFMQLYKDNTNYLTFEAF